MIKTLLSFNIDEVFSILNSEQAELYINGVKFTFNKHSDRYECFKKSCVCAACGLEANKFLFQQSHDEILSGRNHGHFNLYYVQSDKLPILFTKDHIIPKSRGGKNHQSNYVTMCAPCNERKGNKRNV